MVHWPEVMVTFDETTRTLFSADAFGTFGAMNGAIFADEVDFDNEYMDEARRYYCNIVGKYGPQVQSLLKKVHGLDIKRICPLHGFVWRRNLEDYFDKYVKWSTYTPEETGVMIAYASVYGNTENTAEIISSRLRDLGIKTVMFDVSVTPASEIIAAAFKCRHLRFDGRTSQRSGCSQYPKQDGSLCGKWFMGAYKRRPHEKDHVRMQGHDYPRGNPYP